MANDKIVLPSDDKRWRIVNATMRRHGYSPDALIETLHTVQEAFGYLDSVSLHFVAKTLNVPLSRVYGVATFYNFFTMKPQGKHTCVVCLGTACYIKGAAELIETIQQEKGIKPGETTPDKNTSLLVARCFGVCGLAPAAVLDGEVAGKITPSEMVEKLRKWD